MGLVLLSCYMLYCSSFRYVRRELKENQGWEKEVTPGAGRIVGRGSA